MNIILLEEAELVSPVVRLSGRRADHVRQVHRAAPGDVLRVGVVNGLMGAARVVSMEGGQVMLGNVVLDQPPPARLPVTVLLALPRPKMLKRIYQTVATLGVERLVLMNSARVEKSFWSSPWLEPAAIREHLLLGLEQGRDTVLPEVVLERRFKPFVEDRLPEMIAGSLRLVAHPGDHSPCPRQVSGSVTLAIGPEGGFVPYEIDGLKAVGFQPVSLGERILRVETAVTALLSRLF